jgi:branched-chain amino acid transport system ATP-binding protein
MTHAIEARAVSAGYGKLRAVTDVHLTVPAGGVVALLGPNGAGKSTLLKVIAGLMKPWSGHVSFDGRDVTGADAATLARSGVCLVPEGGGFFGELSVGENLSLFRTKRQGLDSVFEAFPALEERLRQRADTMSGGQKRMLALARALLARPKVLMVDEPSLGLSPLMVAEVFAMIRRLADSGLSVLLVEQYVDQAVELADYVWVLRKGRVALAGEASEVAASGAFHELYLGH